MMVEMKSMENTQKKASKKRKNKAFVKSSEPKNRKIDSELTVKNKKPVIKNEPDLQQDDTKMSKDESGAYKEIMDLNTGTSLEDRYPVFSNSDLVQQFQNVPMNNNQKGRIRQLLKDNLKGTSQLLLPDVIHNRIQTMLKNSPNLTDADLRKIRVLYNMLKTAIKVEENPPPKVLKESGEKVKKGEGKKREKKIENKEKNLEKKGKEMKKEKAINEESNVDKKVKGPKRYVAFIGNLPSDINKEKIMDHFAELKNYIKDVRIPKSTEEKKGGIAYLEVANEPSYQLALSKHHSMLGNKRINVLYTTQKNGKISKTTAKGKSAKLIAMQRSGQLMGSVPINRKRSQRRKKMKAALAQQATD